MNMISHLNNGVSFIRGKFNAPATPATLTVPAFEQPQMRDFLKMVPHISDLSHQTLFQVDWSEENGEKIARLRLVNDDKAKIKTPAMAIRFSAPPQANTDTANLPQIAVENNASLGALANWAGRAAPSCYENLCKAIHAFQDAHTQRVEKPEPCIA